MSMPDLLQEADKSKDEGIIEITEQTFRLITALRDNTTVRALISRLVCSKMLSLGCDGQANVSDR